MLLAVTLLLADVLGFAAYTALSALMFSVSKVEKRMKLVGFGYALIAISLLSEVLILTSALTLYISGRTLSIDLLLPKYELLWLLEFVASSIGFGFLASYKARRLYSLTIAFVPFAVGVVDSALSDSRSGKALSASMSLSYLIIGIYLFSRLDLALALTAALRLVSVALVSFAIIRARK